MADHNDTLTFELTCSARYNYATFQASDLARNCKPSGKLVLVNALYGLGQLLISLVAL